MTDEQIKKKTDHINKKEINKRMVQALEKKELENKKKERGKLDKKKNNSTRNKTKTENNTLLRNIAEGTINLLDGDVGALN